ncbi:hypothetical protein LIER_36857 [Lithospermum erythrorhizon]|uniref:Uncharacterized protein n=1 Tax=Lithospermum erythrorhizon TaxID=34254 RepID=A0AAV3PD65_LITER
MGRRGANKKGCKQSNSSSRSGSTPSLNLSLREEAAGRKKQNVHKSVMLKLDHLKNVASWASTEACIPPLAAFFGQRLAASAEALVVPPDPSLFYCQWCESILRPGYNCTVRIEKNHSKIRRHKKSSIPSQNNVSYKCHFCAYRNLIRGTPKGHMKVICPHKVKQPWKPNHAKAADQKSRGQENIYATDHGSSQMDITYVPDADIVEIIAKSFEPDAVRDGNNAKFGDSQMDVIDAPDTNRNEKEVKSGDSRIDIIALADAGRNDNEANCPATPSVKPGISLLDSKMRKRNRSGAKRTETKNISASVDVELTANASSKRKRKGWTSLKEIAERTEKDNGKNSGNLAIPFVI